MVAVSVPIYDPLGRISAAVAIHGPKPRLTIDKAMGHLPALREAADRLQSLMSASKRA